MSEKMEAILEPSIIEERYRLAYFDYELTSGEPLEVLDPTTNGWVSGRVEYSRPAGGYYFVGKVEGRFDPLLSELAHRRLLVRAGR
jgi:hypothetical protein